MSDRTAPDERGKRRPTAGRVAAAAPEPSHDAPYDGLPLPARHWAMVCILLGIALSVLDANVITLALPSIARDFGRPGADSIWVVNAYQLTTLALLLPCATLGDKLGYHRVYLWGAGGMLLGAIGCVLSRDLTSLIAWRTVQGVGAAGFMGVNAALVRLTYPRALLGRGMAMNSVTVAVASVSGPALSAAVLSYGHWTWLFAINIPLLALLIWLGRKALPRREGNPRITLRASDVLQNAAMFSLVFFGVDYLGTRAHSTSAHLTLGLGLLAAGLMVGALFVRGQLRRDTPLLPVDLLRNRVFALSVATSSMSFGAQTLGTIALPFLLLSGQGRTTGETGLLMAAWPLGSILIAPVAGRLIGRINASLLVATGLWLLSLGMTLVATLPATVHNAFLAASMVLCGVGFGLFQSPNNFTLMTSAPLDRAGGAGGMLGTARLVGQTSGAVLVAIVLSLVPGALRGPTLALYLGSACAFVAGLVSLQRRQALASR